MERFEALIPSRVIGSRALSCEAQMGCGGQRGSPCGAFVIDEWKLGGCRVPGTDAAFAAGCVQRMYVCTYRTYMVRAVKVVGVLLGP